MLIIKISCVFFLCLAFVCDVSDDQALEPSWLSSSSSYTVIKRTRPSLKWRLIQWTAFLVLPVLLWGLQHLEPLMHSSHWNLLPPLALWEDPLVKEYEEIFTYFDFSVLPMPKRGPKRTTLDVYAKVFLIKVNEKLHYSSDLREFFFDHPQLIPLVGFSPIYNTTTGILDLEKTLVSAYNYG